MLFYIPCIIPPKISRLKPLPTLATTDVLNFVPTRAGICRHIVCIDNESFNKDDGDYLRDLIADVVDVVLRSAKR